MLFRSGGTKLETVDFVVAFVAVAAISMLATFSFRALPEDAGSELTGVRVSAPLSTKEAAQPGA